jgi:hypothetical protein
MYEKVGLRPLVSKKPEPDPPLMETRSEAQSSACTRMHARDRGCQMAYFRTQDPNLGKFWRVSQEKMLVYFVAVWSILWPFGLFCGHFIYFMVLWYIFHVLVYCRY